MAKKYKVWSCKIVVDGDIELPYGFDWPLRTAAVAATEEAGIPVLACFSGWAGELSEGERLLLLEKEAAEDIEGRYREQNSEDDPQ